MAATSNPPATRRFTAEEVWRMVEIGLLHPDEPYELIDGELLYVSPQNPPHATTIGRLTMVLAAEYGSRDCVVRVQTPIGGITDSIPEPDFAVVTGDVAEQGRHPRADQTLLIIEVSDTSVARDVRKGAIYAAGGAPAYWLVDLNRQTVTVHTGPGRDGTWQVVREIGAGDALELPGTDGVIAVSRLVVPPGQSPAR